MLLLGTKKKVKIRAQVYKQDENFTASSQRVKDGRMREIFLRERLQEDLRLPTGLL